MICMEINYCARQRYSRPLPLIIDQFAGVCWRGGRVCCCLLSQAGNVSWVQTTTTSSRCAAVGGQRGHGGCPSTPGKGKPENKKKKKERGEQWFWTSFFLRARRRCYVRVAQCLSRGKLLPSLRYWSDMYLSGKKGGWRGQIENK